MSAVLQVSASECPCHGHSCKLTIIRINLISVVFRWLIMYNDNIYSTHILFHISFVLRTIIPRGEEEGEQEEGGRGRREGD